MIILLVLVTGIEAKAIRAQVNYLEQVGGSEVELLVFLKSGDHSVNTERNGPVVSLKGEKMGATYTIQRGIVVHLTYHRTFETEAEALTAFDGVKSYLEGRGVGMQVKRGLDHYRLMTGEGNGLRSTLVIITDARFRLSVEVIAMR